MTTKPVDYDELFPGRFLKAGLFKGKPATLTIVGVELEELPQDNGGTRTRGILSFKQTPKQLVLNRTNGECIKAMFGKRIQDWIGKHVTFAPEQAKFGRETVDAVRVVGSPDLERDIEAEIRLPRRKPQSRRLVVTSGSRGHDPVSEPARTREPGEDE
jgi:hypothetical protein